MKFHNGLDLAADTGTAVVAGEYPQIPGNDFLQAACIFICPNMSRPHCDRLFCYLLASGQTTAQFRSSQTGDRYCGSDAYSLNYMYMGDMCLLCALTLLFLCSVPVVDQLVQEQ